ncbi:hypothetical protein, partial [Pseudomonas lurida]|uniref:hypothetical protein n=1 Tax=Pseudomonas lurida TaxID=244566 RepID=UPI001644243D
MNEGARRKNWRLKWQPRPLPINHWLVGDRVDVGTYSYSLINENEGQDWLLDADSRVISPSTNAVLALANAA